MIFTKVLQKGGGGIPSGYRKTKRIIGARNNIAHRYNINISIRNPKRITKRTFKIGA